MYATNSQRFGTKDNWKPKSSRRRESCLTQQPNVSPDSSADGSAGPTKRRTLLIFYAEPAPAQTRALSARQLPTDHVPAVPTREYQSDQSSRQLLRCHPPCCSKMPGADPHRDRRLHLRSASHGSAPARRLRAHQSQRTSALDRSLHIRKAPSGRVVLRAAVPPYP
jgi:hypothetical protein